MKKFAFILIGLLGATTVLAAQPTLFLQQSIFSSSTAGYLNFGNAYATSSLIVGNAANGGR